MLNKVVVVVAVAAGQQLSVWLIYQTMRVKGLVD
jgi:hypothetical protein